MPNPRHFNLAFKICVEAPQQILSHRTVKILPLPLPFFGEVFTFHNEVFSLKRFAELNQKVISQIAVEVQEVADKTRLTELFRMQKAK